ncbi:MAG: hypothetical protein ACX94C_07840 [Phycisphaerales bacterium]
MNPRHSDMRTGGYPQQVYTPKANPKRPLPPGTTHVSDNGEDWYKRSNPPAEVRFARTDKMKYFVRRREQDIATSQSNAWRQVTAEHLKKAIEEGWYR